MTRFYMYCTKNFRTVILYLVIIIIIISVALVIIIDSKYKRKLESTDSKQNFYDFFNVDSFKGLNGSSLEDRITEFNETFLNKKVFKMHKKKYSLLLRNKVVKKGTDKENINQVNLVVRDVKGREIAELEALRENDLFTEDILSTLNKLIFNFIVEIYEDKNPEIKIDIIGDPLNPMDYVAFYKKQDRVLIKSFKILIKSKKILEIR